MLSDDRKLGRGLSIARPRIPAAGSLAHAAALGALTIAAAQRLGGETFLVEEDDGVREVRMAPVGDIVLLDHPADATGPRSINCYLVELQDAATLGANGKKFKIVPQRLLYSLQWPHNGTRQTFGCSSSAIRSSVSLALLAELSR